MRTVCLEYERLRESYELAVKNWVQSILSFNAALVGLAGAQARERRQKALRERNAADDLMTAHELECPQCKRKTWKVIAGTQKRASQIES
jgi:Zn finger protein HypA/HybF involved in hydrogenase expression